MPRNSRRDAPAGTRITVRFTTEEHRQLIDDCALGQTVSDLVRARVAKAGQRGTQSLPEIRALIAAGHALQAYVASDQPDKIRAQALLLEVQRSIERLALRLP